MAPFIAWLTLDARLADGALLEPARIRLKPASDGYETWSGEGGAILGARHRVQAEDALRQLPACRTVPAFVAVCDSFFTNREEVVSQVGLTGLGPVSDAQLVVAAYERWGEAFGSRLAGDFACVVWDVRNRRAVAVADPLGVRSLRYATWRGGWVVSTKTSAVAACIDNAELDRPYLRRLVARDYRGVLSGTPYRNIARLRPGETLVLSPAGERRRQTFTLAPAQGWYGRSDEDRIERFCELLSRAVRVRCSASAPVGSTLSGGLDSSAVACVAASSLHRDDGLRTYSLAFPTVALSDERVFQDAVLRRWPALRPRFVDVEAHGYLAGIGTEPHYLPDEPETHMLRGMILQLTNQAAADGCRRLLSGLFGDQLLGPVDHWSQLSDAPWSSWPAEIRRRSGTWQRATVLGRALLYRVAGIDTSRRRFGQAPPGLPSASARTSLRLLAGPHAFQLLRNVEGWAAHTGVEWSHPFLDQPLVEFMLGQPPHARTHAGVSKVILRSALRGILPDEVRTRTHWTSVDAAALRTLPGEIARMERWASRSLAVEHGLVSPRVAACLLAACRHQPSHRAVQEIAPLVGVEEWLRLSAVGVRCPQESAIRSVQ